MEAELKRQLDSYLDMYEEKKAEFEQAEKEYFGLARECFDNFEKFDKLQNQYEEAERAYEVVACALANFALENRGKIKAH